MGPRLCGWCSGASGTNVWSRASTASSTSTGAVERRAAVHHPVSHAGERPIAERAAHARAGGASARRVTEVRVLRPVTLRHHRAVRPARDEVRRALALDPLELAAHVEDELARLLEEERELRSTTSRR